MMNIDHNLQTHFISIQAGCTPYMTGVWKDALNIMVDANTPPERFHVANKNVNCANLIILQVRSHFNNSLLERCQSRKEMSERRNRQNEIGKRKKRPFCRYGILLVKIKILSCTLLPIGGDDLNRSHFLTISLAKYLTP